MHAVNHIEVPVGKTLANVGYDVTRQWIEKAGPFEYDYRWLSSSGTHADMMA